MTASESPVSFPLPSARRPVTTGPLSEFPEDPIACMRRLHALHGDFAVLEESGRRLAFVFSPELNRQVLSRPEIFQSQFFAVRGGRKSAQRRVTSGLLSQNGTQHRQSRRMMMEVFSRRVLPQYHNTIVDLTTEFLDELNIGDEVDVNARMVQLMLRMTSALLFGVSDADAAEDLGRRIDTWAHRNHEVGIGAIVASEDSTAAYDSLLTLADELETGIRNLFAQHRQASHERTNILSLLFEAQKANTDLGDDQLIGHATLLFAAAHLTTAHTLTWTLFLLAQHPEVMNRLRREISDHVAGNTPTMSELESMGYLENVIRESMRVLPASSYSQRVTAEEVTLGGLRLPKWTPVVFSQFMTHHRGDLFDNPDEFNPDRWEQISPGPYEFLPFGAGGRMCIGAPLAMTELRAILTTVLKRVQFSVVPNSVIDARVISTMLGPTTPVPARVTAPVDLQAPVPVSGTVRDLVQLPSADPRQQRRAA